MTADNHSGRDGPDWARPRSAPHSGNGRSEAGPKAGSGGFALDAWTLTEGVLRRWHWILLSGLGFAAIVFLYTSHIWRNDYTASVQLIRFETQNSTVYYKPRQLTDHTFASLLKAPELLQMVGSNAAPAT